MCEVHSFILTATSEFYDELVRGDGLRNEWAEVSYN